MIFIIFPDSLFFIIGKVIIGFLTILYCMSCGMFITIEKNEQIDDGYFKCAENNIQDELLLFCIISIKLFLLVLGFGILAKSENSFTKFSI